MSSQITGITAEATASEQEGQSVQPQLRRRSRVEMWVFIIPAFLFQLAWGWYPIVMGLMLGFTNGNVLRPLKFVGWDNYNRVLTDPLTADAFKNTIVFSSMSLILLFMIPIFVAILIMEMPRKITYLMMFLWFLPLSSMTGLMLTRYFYDTDYGLYQFILHDLLHLPHQDFLNDPNLVLFWLVFPGILFYGPGLIYMATLQGIPSSYYEAAEVEGAGFWRKIWTITLPRLRPIIHMSLVFAFAGFLQPFDAMKVLTEGGPQGRSYTIMFDVYDSIIKRVQFGDAAALSAVIFVVTLVGVTLFRVLIKDDPDI